MGKRASPNNNVTNSLVRKHIFTYQLFDKEKYDKNKLLYLCDTLEDKCKQIASVYQFQLELGEETGRYHFQGVIMCDQKHRGQALVNKLKMQITNHYYKGELIGNDYTEYSIDIKKLLKEDKEQNLTKEVEYYSIGWDQPMTSAKGFDYTEKEETAIEPELFRRFRGGKAERDKYFRDPRIKAEKGSPKGDNMISAINNGWNLEQVEMLDPTYYAFNRNVFEQSRLKHLEKKNKEDYPTNYDPYKTVIYIEGESGVGKNRLIDFITYSLNLDICYVNDYKKDPFQHLKEQEILLLNEYKGQFNKEFVQELLDKRVNISLPARYYNKMPLFKFVIMTSVVPFRLLHNTDYNKIDNIRQLHRRVDFVIRITKNNIIDVRQKLTKIMQDKILEREKFIALSLEEKIAFLESYDNGDAEPVYIGYSDIKESVQVEFTPIDDTLEELGL